MYSWISLTVHPVVYSYIRYKIMLWVFQLHNSDINLARWQKYLVCPVPTKTQMTYVFCICFTKDVLTHKTPWSLMKFPKTFPFKTQNRYPTVVHAGCNLLRVEFFSFQVLSVVAMWVISQLYYDIYYIIIYYIYICLMYFKGCIYLHRWGKQSRQYGWQTLLYYTTFKTAF